MFSDNGEFINQVKKELFSDKVYIYLTNGEIIELPKGATIIDCAYKISDEIGNTMIGAYVNDKSVSVDYILKNKDRVRIITDDLSFGPRDNWEEETKTSHAKLKIKEFKKN